MHLGKARLTSCPVIIKRAAYSCGLAALVLLCGGRALQNAIAEGDTRTISLHHMHTDEDITITFKRDGRYDEAALNKLNWFLRDWRKQQETKMDPHLIDLIWEVQRETGSKEPVWVVCGYRSPETNAMLRRRSSGVARFSQHMLGHAMDFYIPGVQLDQLRAIGLRMQRGGVGFYPTSGSPFVHMDTGGVRMWPRMTRDQLVRVFPNQRTVYIPSDGRPLAGYELALADIRKRGDGSDVGTSIAADASRAGDFATVYKLIHMARGNGDEEEADGGAERAGAGARGIRAAAHARQSGRRRGDRSRRRQARRPEGEARAGRRQRGSQTRRRKGQARGGRRQRGSQTRRREDQAGQDRFQGAGDRPRRSGAGGAPRRTRSFSHAASGRACPTAWLPGARPNRPLAQSPRWRVRAASQSPMPIPPDRSRNSQPRKTIAFRRKWRSLTRRKPEAMRRRAPFPFRRPTGTEALRTALVRAAAVQTGDNATTVAVKRVNGRTASVVFTVSTKKASPVLADMTRLSDPWLRAIVVSPSVNRFLCISTLGVRDFRSLAELMVKPANSVMMTFAADPNPGLEYNHFNGSAVVFIPTVSYTLRTAQLQ